jgi:lipoprotein-anchoring transpeptidase ErfK/SrfK
MRGPDVVAVQRRLKSLGFYQGPLDGVYGRGTTDAVVALQARRNLTPDGTVGPATYEALGQGPTPPSLGNQGPTITIDLEQRRLYFRRRGATQRTYPVAVGAPDAPTPVGRWVVVEKAVNPGGPFGARWMRVNIPWGGYPIHSKIGPTSVPTRTAHHHRRHHFPVTALLGWP